MRSGSPAPDGGGWPSARDPYRDEATSGPGPYRPGRRGDPHEGPAGRHEMPFGPEISWPYGFRQLDPESRRLLESGYAPAGSGADGYGADGYGAEGYGAEGYGAEGYGAEGYGAEGYGRGGHDPAGYGLPDAGRGSYDHAGSRYGGGAPGYGNGPCYRQPAM